MFDDVRHHQDRLLIDPDFDASFDQLIDTTRVAKFDISVAEARILASRPIVSPESRRAFVATNPHILGLGQMLEIYQCAEVHVFHSMDEAWNWLEMEEEKHENLQR